METETQTLRDLKEPGEELEAEARRVFEWRRDELRKLGYSRSESVEIAYSGIVLADLRLLLTNGATLAQAARILADTDFLGDVNDEERHASPSDKKKRARRNGDS